MAKKPKTIQEYFDQSLIYDNGKLIAPMTETHCHLDMLKDVNLDELQNELESLGISRIITIATSNKNFSRVQEIQNSFPNTYFTLGTHPHEAKDFHENDLSHIREVAKSDSSKLVAVGEIGLDYYYDFSPREKQIEVFKKYLELSIELNLPVVIHTRDADEDMAQILKEYGPQMPKKGVVHSFSSGLELGALAAKLGFFLGFNGMITFKNADLVRQAVNQTPINQILVETDSPFLTPHPFRGQQNTPTYIPLVMEKIAEIKNIPLRECMASIEKNATKCFFS